MNAMSAGLRSLGLILLAAALACNGGGGASSDVPGGADGSDLPDVPPLGALVVDRGDLDADAAQWNALGRRWTRATSAAVQAVVATNSVLYRDLGTLGMSPFQDALKAANGAAAVLASLEDYRLRLPQENSWLEEWKSRCAMLGRPVAIRSGGRVVRGQVLDVAPLQGLVVRDGHGATHFLSARTATVVS